MQALPSVFAPVLIEHDAFGAGEVLDGCLGTETQPPLETGARLLMRAVLRDAILCLQGLAPDVPRHLRRRAAEEARIWILSRRTNYTFSFVAICDVLELDADALRQGLLRIVATPAGAVPAEARREMVRTVRSTRLRGNTRTRVLAPRRRRSHTQAGARRAVAVPARAAATYGAGSGSQGEPA